MRMMRLASFFLVALVVGFAPSAFDKAKDAVERNDLSTLRRILHSDPSVARGVDGFQATLLHKARSKEAVKELLSRKAVVDARNTYGSTPLHEAVRRNSVPVVQALVAAGADVKARMKNGTTPLHVAADCAGREIGEILLKKGAPTDALGVKQRTPLHVAADAGNPAMVRLLLERGADYRLEDVEGRTPLDIAKYRKECCGVRGSRVEIHTETILLLEGAVKRKAK